MGSFRRGLIVLVALAASVTGVGVAPARVGAVVSFDQFACGLLSASDVSAVAGQASADGLPGTVSPVPGAMVSMCDFAPQDGGTAFNVTIRVERYPSASAAHDAFLSGGSGGQPTQVSGFDEATINTGTARLRHGTDVVSIDMFENPSLPPTALATLAAAVAQHYTSPSTSTQKPAVAGPGDVNPCAMSLKGLKAAFGVAVTSAPAVSDPGTLACTYTFANHGSVLVTTTTPAQLAKLQPPMTVQQYYDNARAALTPSDTVDLTGFPGQAAISSDTTAIADVSTSSVKNLFIEDARKQSEYLKLVHIAKLGLNHLVKDAANPTGTKVDPQAIKAAQDALNKIANNNTVSQKDLQDLGALVAMLLAASYQVYK
jgi:hypothetical protein